MSSIRKLINQTAIYGTSSIIGRFLNFLLTPLYALQFSNEQYGIITEMYAYVAFLVIFLTYGMETAFFRFSTTNKKGKINIYSNTLYSLITSSAIFVAMATIFSQNIADWLKYPNHKEYIIWFSLIVSLDAVSSIPLAKLRLQEKAKKFALVNLLNVGVNIFLNLFFLIYCKEAYENGYQNWITENLYNPEIGVGYVFISNLFASIIKFGVLMPIMSFKGPFDFTVLKEMISYAAPMLLVGLAYVVNETLDRAMLKSILFNQYLENGEVEERYYYKQNSYMYKDLKKAITSSDTAYQWRRVYVRENKSGVCPTLTANMGTGGHNVPLVLTDEGIRKLTPRECFNFQGFPKSFILPSELANSHLYKQAGNAVTVDLIKILAKQIYQVL